jgi:hypothetical protein
MQFIEVNIKKIIFNSVEDYRNEQATINTNDISMFFNDYNAGNTRTKIHMRSGLVLFVDESYEQVRDKINGDEVIL